MLKQKFFIDILKATPTDSVVETTGYISYETAIELGLVSFENFVPKSVGLTFKLDLTNTTKWIDFFKKTPISDLITQYWIYKDNSEIAYGADYLEINAFKKELDKWSANSKSNG